MMNFRLYQAEFRTRIADERLLADLDDAFQWLEWFLEGYPALNPQSLGLFVHWLKMRQPNPVTWQVELCLLARFFDWLSAEVEPGFARQWQPVRSAYLPVPERELPWPTFSPRVVAFMDYLEAQPIPKVDPSNWQSVAQPQVVLRNIALFHTILWSGQNTVDLLALNRAPFDQWLLAGGSDLSPVFLLGKMVIRTSSLVRTWRYLSSRQDDFRPLFISHSPTASAQARLSREMVWRTAKDVWTTLGYPEANLKTFREETTYETVPASTP